MSMAAEANLLVATGADVFTVDPGRGRMRPDGGRNGGSEERRPTCLSADPAVPRRAWCGTAGGGLFRTDDRGRSWRPVGLEDENVTAVAVSPSAPGTVWAGTEPSALWRSGDGGATWEPGRGLRDLPSSSEWAFPPRPETDHVRWIGCHPRREGHLWLAIEAGALVTTPDGGKTWRDRVPGGPRDTHELAIHPEKPDALRASAGDGYFESEDGGESWAAPREGLDVGYLRSVAIDPGDPDTVVVSASSRARSAYVAGRSDGRLYRRAGRGAWEPIVRGWPDPPETIAPLLLSGTDPGELWAADERGIHHSDDGGRSWERIAAFPTAPSNLRALVLQAGGPA